MTNNTYLARPAHRMICEAHRAMHGRQWETALALVRSALPLLAGGEPRRFELTFSIMESWFGQRLDVVHLAGARRRGDSLARAFAHEHVHVAGDLFRARQLRGAKLIMERCEIWLVVAESANVR